METVSNVTNSGLAKQWHGPLWLSDTRHSTECETGDVNTCKEVYLCGLAALFRGSGQRNVSSLREPLLLTSLWWWWWNPTIRFLLLRRFRRFKNINKIPVISSNIDGTRQYNTISTTADLRAAILRGLWDLASISHLSSRSPASLNPLSSPCCASLSRFSYLSTSPRNLRTSSLLIFLILSLSSSSSSLLSVLEEG